MKIPGFSFLTSFRIQCEKCFQCAISMFRKSVSQYFCSKFLTSNSFFYPYVKKLHRVPYLTFRTNFFQNKYNRQYLDNGRPSITSCALRDFISCDIIVEFWYCLACYILYLINPKERQRNSPRDTSYAKI